MDLRLVFSAHVMPDMVRLGLLPPPSLLAMSMQAYCLKMLQPCQRSISSHNSQTSRRNISDSSAAGQLHTPLEFLVQDLDHQFDALLAIILNISIPLAQKDKNVQPIPTVSVFQPNNTQPRVQAP